MSTIPITFKTEPVKQPVEIKGRVINTRALTIQRLRDEERMSYSNIAQAVGLSSKQRAHQLYLHAKTIPQQGHPMYGLSTRARNCLTMAGVCNADELSKALDEGAIDLFKIPGLGTSTNTEIMRWIKRSNQ